ncbi:hypothetical protein MXB_2719 [Myxobolus squamalis]|nr:hypothetical protein MXB_2719 [Myxobolus squamalis]
MNSSEKYLIISIARLQELQKIISSFMYKVTNNELNWSTITENYILITNMTSSIIRSINNIGLPVLHNLVIVPSKVLYEPDQTMFKYTAGRISMLNQDISM